MRPIRFIVNLIIIIVVLLIVVPVAATAHVVTEAFINPEFRGVVTGKYWIFEL